MGGPFSCRLGPWARAIRPEGLSWWRVAPRYEGRPSLGTFLVVTMVPTHKKVPIGGETRLLRRFRLIQVARKPL